MRFGRVLSFDMLVEHGSREGPWLPVMLTGKAPRGHCVCLKVEVNDNARRVLAVQLTYIVRFHHDHRGRAGIRLVLGSWFDSSFAHGCR